MADELDRAPHLKLLLVGDGATFDAVASFVKAQGLEDRIVLTGRVKHAEVPGLLAAMDLAVLPSAGDYTSPVKLFEFMACGVPPVAPDFGPIQEVLADGETGWLFSAENLEKAVETVLARSRDEAALARVGRAAREYIRRERQWSNNAAQLIEFHQQLASAS
jgi:glycosyltransferase involved in cell wall biosynthesis